MRLVVRQIRRAPGFSALLVVSLGVGIGGNVLLFGAIRSLLLRAPTNVRDPVRVVRLLTVSPSTHGGNVAIGAANYPLFLDLQRNAPAFESIAAFTSRRLSIGIGANAVDAQAEIVSASFFSVLGAKPLLGRTFSVDDGYPAGEAVGGPPLAVLSYELWQSRYGADPLLLGRLIRIGTTTYQVVGIMPAGFRTVEDQKPDLWLPLNVVAGETEQGIDLSDRNRYSIAIFGRLRPGVSTTAAEEQATVTWDQNAAFIGGASLASVHVFAASLIRGRGPDAPPEVQVTLWLAGVSILVLLITCANVANLLLGRALSRRHEVAVRLALGAGRGRIARQMLAEGMVLAAAGAAAALGLAALGAPLLNRLSLGDSRGSVLDPTLFAFAALLAVGTGVLISLVPALQNLRSAQIDDLRGSNSSHSRRATRLRLALVCTQSTLGMMLLVLAVLFSLSLRRVGTLDLGLDVKHTIRALVDLDNLLVSNDEAQQVYDEMLRRVRALPEVAGAAVAGSDPYLGGRAVGAHTPEHDADYFWPRGVAQVAIEAAVGGGFFQAVGAASLRGRDFTRGDNRGSAAVAIVNAPLARILYPTTDPIGRCVILPARARQSGGSCTTIIGVLSGVWYGSIINRDKPMVYIPLSQQTAYAGYSRPQGIFIRVNGEPGRAVEEIRRTLQAVRSDLPAVHVTLLDDTVESEVRPWRLGATMFGLFGVIALLVAAIGLYSVVAFTVAERSFDIAIRLALGARRRNILATAAGKALSAVAVGVGIGSIGSIAIRGWIGPLLFRTSPDDPLVIVAIAATLFGVGAVGALIPTIRAVRFDPAAVLRSS